MGGVSRFRDRNRQETLGGEAVLSALVGSHLGATTKGQKAVFCWSLPAARESRQALAHSESKARLLPGGEGPAQSRDADTIPQTRAPLLLPAWLGVLRVSWMLWGFYFFFEFCTVAMNTESGPQQTQAPFRAIHIPGIILNIGPIVPCWASRAFKEEIHCCGHTIFLRSSQVF